MKELVVYPSDKPYGTRFVWLYGDNNLVVQFVARISHEGVLEPWDLGFHCSFDPGWATSMSGCDVLNKPCWYDGSPTNAESVFLRLCRDGLDGLWAELEDYREGLWDGFAKERLAA